MMGEYRINEIEEYHCDESGYLTVYFRLEDDPEDGFRLLETDEYYYYAEKESIEDGLYHTKEWEEGDFEGDGHYYSHFDFREWLEYEHNEGKVIEFIYSNYTIEELPEINFN